MTGEKQNICFLIITYNAEDYLDNLFKSINNEYEIFVVDNGSNDNTTNILKSKEIDYVINQKNGYAAGINKGLRIIKNKGYKYAFVLNQDTKIIEFEIDYSLLEKYAVVQPLVLNEGLTVGVDELKMNVYGFVFPYRYRKVVIEESKEMLFFSGAGFIINVNKFLYVGDFDENYFMYYEDADYAARIFLANEKIYLTNKIKIIHFYKNSVFSLKKMKQLLRSRKIFLNKYLTSLWRLLIFLPDFKGSRDLIPVDDKEKFSKYIIGKSLFGFNTLQVPLVPRIIFNVSMYFYSLLIKLIITSSLKKNNQ